MHWQDLRNLFIVVSESFYLANTGCGVTKIDVNENENQSKVAGSPIYSEYFRK